MLLKWNFFVIEIRKQLQFVKQTSFSNRGRRVQSAQREHRSDVSLTLCYFGQAASKVIFTQKMNHKEEITQSPTDLESRRKVSQRPSADREWAQNVSAGVNPYFRASVRR